jgi:hypothetical protein
MAKKYFYIGEASFTSRNYDGEFVTLSKIFTNLKKARNWAEVNTDPDILWGDRVYRVPMEKKILFLVEGGHIVSWPKGWEEWVEKVA